MGDENETGQDIDVVGSEIAPEWSYMVDADTVIANETTPISITADESVCEALARRLKVEAIRNVSADVTLMRVNGGVSVYVAGEVKAEVTQNCVITLVPVQSHVSEAIEGWFTDPTTAISLAKARHNKDTKNARGEKPMLHEDEDPEQIIDGQIDVAELATQFLALGINPYPHAEGVTEEQLKKLSISKDIKISKDSDEPDPLKNPFAALKDWKNRQR